MTVALKESGRIQEQTKNEKGKEQLHEQINLNGKNAEFAEKYLKKGLKILVSGRIQTGSYVNQEGNSESVCG